LRLVLPGFAYEAEQDGVVERELCPVFTGRVDIAAGQRPTVDPGEVEDLEWVSWADFRDDVLGERRQVSVWCRAQVPVLAELGPDPASWPTGDPHDLPPACPPEPPA
jgi:isopentenyl-diphosphate delta-isomerase